MNKKIIAALLAITPLFATAQLGGLMNRVKNKVTQRVDSKVDKAIDHALDKAEGKNNTGTNNTTTDANEHTNSLNEKTATPIKSFTKYDFIPGAQILYYDNFDQENVGELSNGWNTNGSGEVVTLENQSGKWLRLHNPFIYLSKNNKEFTGNYTAEFDLILQLKNNGWMYPTFSAGFLSSGTEGTTDNVFLKDFNKYAAVIGTIYPAENSSSRIQLESFTDARTYFKSDAKMYGDLDKYYGQPVHIAIQVQQQRFRMWINESKVFDVPKAVDTGYRMNQVFFKVGATNYKEEQYAIYISNIKTAAGLPDTRHRLIEEGKFSTTGILFDINEATIQPSSYAVIKEIAGVLKENPSIKIKVIGHTSSDGDDKANMELSKKRAAAVKQMLVNDFGIDAAMVECEGKGESQPVADNKTSEGKAANRRVEFIKL